MWCYTQSDMSEAMSSYNMHDIQQRRKMFFHGGGHTHVYVHVILNVHCLASAIAH